MVLGRAIAAGLPLYRVGVQALGLDRMAHLPFAYASKSHPRFRTVERSRVDCAISCGGTFCPKLGPNTICARSAAPKESSSDRIQMTTNFAA